MNTQRLLQLEQFLKESPNDPFVIYAIATEYREVEPKKAWEYYEILLQNHADYTATYYHAALLAWELGELKRAEAIFKKGIEVCLEKNEQHHLKELKQAYSLFLEENNED